MKTYINETDFYTNGEAEHYQYCQYKFNVHTDSEDTRIGISNFDIFALIDNSNPMYIRLCKCRNGRLSPCGHAPYPSIDSRFAHLSNEERDSECPKISWGFIAFFLSKLKYDNNLEDFTLLLDDNSIFNEYYSICLEDYLTKHSGLKYRKLSSEDKEQAFIKEHIEVEAKLKERCKLLESYSELFDLACDYYDNYKKWVASKIKKDSVLTDGGFILPKEIDKGNARCIFNKAIKEGFININKDGTLKWNKTKVLLSYLCGRIYCNDFIKTDDFGENPIWRQSGTLPNAELCKLFNLDKDLNPSRNKLLSGNPPKGYVFIDSLFEAAD